MHPPLNFLACINVDHIWSMQSLFNLSISRIWNKLNHYRSWLWFVHQFSLSKMTLQYLNIWMRPVCLDKYALSSEVYCEPEIARWSSFKFDYLHQWMMLISTSMFLQFFFRYIHKRFVRSFHLDWGNPFLF